MDDRQSIPLSDAALDRGIDRDITRALAINPSPEFLARVRTRVASEPAPRAWRVSWTMCFAGGAVAAVAIGIVTVALNRDKAPVAGAPLAARAIETAPATAPPATSAFERIARSRIPARGSTGSPRAKPGSARPELVDDQPSRFALRRSAVASAKAEGRAATPAPLFDPRETRALQAFIARVGNGRVDLSPLLNPAGPAPMELPPIDELSISPITIDPIAPADGAQGVRP